MRWCSKLWRRSLYIGAVGWSCHLSVRTRKWYELFVTYVFTWMIPCCSWLNVGDRGCAILSWKRHWISTCHKWFECRSEWYLILQSCRWECSWEGLLSAVVTDIVTPLCRCYHLSQLVSCIMFYFQIQVEKRSFLS